MKRLICVWLHRGVMPAIATRYTVGQSSLVRHEPLGQWLPFNIYQYGVASAWPRRGVGTDE